VYEQAIMTVVLQ